MTLLCPATDAAALQAACRVPLFAGHRNRWIVAHTNLPNTRIIGSSVTQAEGRELVESALRAWFGDELGIFKSADMQHVTVAALSGLPADPDSDIAVENGECGRVFTVAGDAWLYLVEFDYYGNDDTMPWPSFLTPPTWVSPAANWLLEKYCADGADVALQRVLYPERAAAKRTPSTAERTKKAAKQAAKGALQGYQKAATVATVATVAAVVIGGVLVYKAF